MTAVSESDSSLATQCLDFCQALARQGKDFKISITIGSTFAFSLDTKEGKTTLPTRIQKKEKPIYPEKKCKTQRRVSCQEIHLGILCVNWFGIQPEPV